MNSASVQRVTGHISIFKQFPCQSSKKTERPSWNVIVFEMYFCLATNAWPIPTLHKIYSSALQVVHSFRLHYERIPTLSWTHETTIKIQKQDGWTLNRVRSECYKNRVLVAEATPQNPMRELQITTLFQTTPIVIVGGSWLQRLVLTEPPPQTPPCSISGSTSSLGRFTPSVRTLPSIHLPTCMCPNIVSGIVSIQSC